MEPDQRNSHHRFGDKVSDLAVAAALSLCRAALTLLHSGARFCCALSDCASRLNEAALACTFGADLVGSLKCHRVMQSCPCAL